jgi:signal transduction histidine kinase
LSVIPCLSTRRAGSASKQTWQSVLGPHLNEEQRELRLYRWLLLCAGAGYLSWWFFVHLSLPGAFNPFVSRALVVACFLSAWAASYFSAAVARGLGSWLVFCCCLATVHYFYLFDRNHTDLNWMIGSYITIIAVCAILQTARSLLLYSLCVALLSGAILLRGPQVPYVVFLPGVLTILLFANVGLRGRLKLLHARKDAEGALTLANRELESFNYSVAHDLRAPLRGMSDFAQVLLEDYDDKLDEVGRGHLHTIQASGQRMSGLIEALLALSGVSRHEIQNEWVDLSAMARATATRLAREHPERSVSVIVQEGLGATIDRHLCSALIDNLFGNAWKFTSKAATPRIELGSTEVNGSVVLFVKDNGAGFEMAYAKRLFAPFERLHSAAEFPGTGIGLATVQRIVHRYGGRIWAEGVVDQGATFYFTLSPAS